MVIETIQKKNLAYYLKSYIGHFEFCLFQKFRWKKNELLILNLHSTPKQFEENFKDILKFLKKNFNIIGPESLVDFYIGLLKSEKASLLFTFDDGLKNNFRAAKILKDNGITALFFVVPNFVNASENKQGKDYYLQNIRPIVNPKFDKEPEDFESMNWKEIQILAKNGHAIGSHSMSHRLALNSSEDELLLEIVKSKEEIERKTNLSVIHFCSPNNTALSVSEKAEELIEEHYDYHFTTFHGSNSALGSKQLIKRINIEIFWGVGAVKFAFSRFQNKRLGRSEG
jgi:peptidoglycan/xylan/chitin deacetylase (PgdA/CDA1 family)